MRENMNVNFLKMSKRVMESIEMTDLVRMREVLSSIKSATLVSGVGGSGVVSNYVAKVLECKNNIICNSVTARDLKYLNLSNYYNIIACSYSGNNLGVDVAFDNELDKYLLSKNQFKGINNISYNVSDNEHSFISLSSTLIPMTMMLLYYCDYNVSLVEDILTSTLNFKINDKIVYEVLSGYETSTASKFIESTFVESGIGIPIIHDKYDYCHGRSTLNYHYENNLIFFNNGSQLDRLYLDELGKYYTNIIRFDRKYSDVIINDYYFTYLSMLLCYEIAKKRGKDLSIVQYSPLVKKLYPYKGEM